MCDLIFMKQTSIFWIFNFVFLALLFLYNTLFPLRPQAMLIRFFALGGFFLLCVSLLIGPLALMWPKYFAQLIRTRKVIGVLGFILILLHFLLVILYSYELDFSFIFSSWTILIGFIAFIILIPIALTSNNFSMKTLGFFNWKLMQRVVYIAFILSFIHFIFNLNGLFIEMQTGGVFLNLAEVVMIIFGLIVILFQVAGFFVNKKKRAVASTPSETK